MANSFTTNELSIKALLSDKNSKYLIPYYQRQYSWTSDDECQKLWDDILSFALPTETTFDSESEEYYFGSVVMFKSGEVNQPGEIIDGQQRLITFTLLLRAFYQVLEPSANQHTDRQNEDRLVTGIVRDIEKCIWILKESTERTDSFRIESQTITDADRGDFKKILIDGLHEDKIPRKSSNYIKNYKFFLDRIKEARDANIEDFMYLPGRILENCFVLTVEATSRDSALRIFSTLNTRGMPLRDSDIFKAEFYRYFDQQGRKDFFVGEWSEVEKTCSNGTNETSMDDLFLRYMRYNVGSDKIKMREFYERSISPNGTDQPIKYGRLHSDRTFYCIRMLAHFWQAVFDDDDPMLSREARKRLFVLKMMPNDTWKEFVSVYFLKCIEGVAPDNQTDILSDDWGLDEKFVEFLDKTIAYVLALSLTTPGRDAMRSALYRESGNIIRADGITGYAPFSGQSFTESAIRARFDVKSDDFAFDAGKKTTKPFLAWWMLWYEKDADLLSLENVPKGKIQIEHIFPVNRQDVDPLKDLDNLESLGNKALIEQTVNSTASDFSFETKCKIYLEGYKSGRGKKKYPSTKNAELRTIAKDSKDKKQPVFPVFKDDEIKGRNSQIVDAFVGYLRSMGLLKRES